MSFWIFSETLIHRYICLPLLTSKFYLSWTIYLPNPHSSSSCYGNCIPHNCRKDFTCDKIKSREILLNNSRKPVSYGRKSCISRQMPKCQFHPCLLEVTDNMLSRNRYIGQEEKRSAADSASCLLHEI